MTLPPPRRIALLILSSAALGGTVLAFAAAVPRVRAAIASASVPAQLPPLEPGPVPAIVVHRTAPAPAPSPSPEPVPAELAYVVRRVMTLPGPFRHGNSYWDESGAPAAGPVVVTVDLEAQVLSVFRDGYEIGTAVILYGANDKPTPLGVFRVTQKDATHVSNLYDAPMPFMLRLTNDGVSIHGADVVRDRATHGCVGVPTAFAKKLFGVVKLGDRVIVTRGERLGVGQAVKAAG